MSCATCKYRGESPISGMCEGCVNGSKHSSALEARRDKLVGEARQTKEYQMEKIKLRLEREIAEQRKLLIQAKAALETALISYYNGGDTSGEEAVIDTIDDINALLHRKE